MWSNACKKSLKQWMSVSNGRAKLKKLSDCMSVVVHARQQNVYGFRYLRFTDNVLLPILTFGKHTGKLCLVRGIKRLEKKQVKLITQSRFNCTMRQRIARLVRKTLSFSKKLENHIGAIWLFIHHYNKSLHV